MKKQAKPVLIDDIKKKVKELAALREIGKEISSSLNLRHVLATIIDRALELLNAKKGCIMLLDNHTGKMRVGLSKGLSKEETEKIKAQTLNRISLSHIAPFFLSAPLKLKNKTIGAIHITHSVKEAGFTSRHLQILKEFADQAVIAIDNAESHQQLRKVVLNTIKALAVSIDQRDHYTSCHSENVARYAVAIAKEMDLPEGQIEKIEHAAQLHDIGKIGIRDYILSKPGKLTPSEWDEIRSHSKRGAEILKPLEFLDGIIDIVKEHHERCDGKGYPNGLKEKNIKIGARIMAVADSFDAMTSERPYRPAMPRKEAIEEIKRASGIMYAPKIVDAFLRAIAKKTI